MIGTKFEKPLQENEIIEGKKIVVGKDDKGQDIVSNKETRRPNPAPNTYAKYVAAATWCNSHNATIEDKGDYYEVVAIPAPTLEEVRERKLTTLNSTFESWREEGATLISSLGFEADADEKANADVNGLVTYGEPAVFMDAHNQPHRLTLEQLKVLQREIIESASYGYQKKWTYRDAINNAQTVDALNAIEIVFTPKDFSNSDDTE